MSQTMTREKVSNEALYILKSLRENSRLGRSNKLADVKSFLEPSVSLEFDSYFFFLRKFHYIAMDREAQLKLTDQGERVVDGDYGDKFSGEVGEFFADQILGGDETNATVIETAPTSRPPPPPATDLLVDADEPAAPAPQSSGRPGGVSRRAPPPPPVQDEPLTSSPPPPPQVTAPNNDRPASSGYSHSPPPPPPMTATIPLTAVAVQGPPLGGAGVGAGKGQDVDLRYVKYDPIGSGPLGTVFKGKHNALGLDICVKELKDIFGYFSFLQRGEVIKRLKKELCAQAQVKHPGVVQVCDQNTDVARPYFVMELCKGSLREKLDQGGGKGVPVKLGIRYFLQMAYALRAAHQSGLTHHNLKPENVLFDTWGNAKLADFGLSRVIEVDQTKGMPQVFVGTGGMGYMSPELIARAKDVGPSSDVYALGILLYEMMTGTIPGRRSALPSEVNSECPSKLDPIFDKMTQDRKDQRYGDLDGMLDDFYAAFTDSEYLAKGDLILWSEAAPAK
ncbi:MAG: serine/threonine protein kinase [Myxococcaceae bacterium]|nr:serine/threonine protein kinase [Myxococcaceae bacterium]